MQPGVTWIRVEKPTFDLVGVILSSLKLTGLLLLLALAVGVFVGLGLLRYRRRHPAPTLEPLSLRVDA